MTTSLLSANQDRINEYTNTYLASSDVMDVFMDKGETIKLANDAQVPTPRRTFPNGRA